MHEHIGQAGGRQLGEVLTVKNRQGHRASNARPWLARVDQECVEAVGLIGCGRQALSPGAPGYGEWVPGVKRCSSVK